jgi:hypothetical protein
VDEIAVRNACGWFKGHVNLQSFNLQPSMLRPVTEVTSRQTEGPWVAGLEMEIANDDHVFAHEESRDDL